MLFYKSEKWRPYLAALEEINDIFLLVSLWLLMAYAFFFSSRLGFLQVILYRLLSVPNLVMRSHFLTRRKRRCVQQNRGCIVLLLVCIDWRFPRVFLLWVWLFSLLSSYMRNSEPNVNVLKALQRLLKLTFNFCRAFTSCLAFALVACPSLTPDWWSFHLELAEFLIIIISSLFKHYLNTLDTFYKTSISYSSCSFTNVWHV